VNAKAKSQNYHQTHPNTSYTSTTELSTIGSTN